MPVNHGATQHYALTLDKILDHAARWHSDKEVVTIAAGGGAGRIDYRDLATRARRISALLASFGIGQGECVATLAWNTQEHMAAWYGIMGMGAVCHTLNPRLRAEELSVALRQSQARILVAGSDLCQMAIDAASGDTQIDAVLIIDRVEGIPAVSDRNIRVIDLASELKRDLPPVNWGEFPEHSPCGLCFTSGTTGAPKGVTYTHRGNFLHTLRQLQADVAAITAKDVVLPVVPMFHANAWGLPFACPAVGATLVMPGSLTDGESLARMIAEHSVTLAVGVPTVWIDLFDYLDRSGIELPSLKRLMVGGAPMPAALTQRIAEHSVEVQQTWGMTELSPLGTAMRPGQGNVSGVHSGSPALGIDLMLESHDGKPLPLDSGQEGRLLVRGPSVAERYFGEAEPATRDGWFDTGDLAMIDSKRNLHITGRAKDLIKSGGEWVNPGQIESAVGELSQVTKVAVIAREHPKWGERPIMVVELAEGASISDEDILDPVRQRFAKWWVPDEVIRVPAIPLAATGKIDKRQLQAQFGSS